MLVFEDKGKKSLPLVQYEKEHSKNQNHGTVGWGVLKSQDLLVIKVVIQRLLVRGVSGGYRISALGKNFKLGNKLLLNFISLV